jgi:NADH:ubiquinone oxidoreductase subunit 2 (subunit N)
VDAVPAVRGSVEFQAAIRWSAILSALVAAFQVTRAADWRGVVAGLLILDAGMLAAITLAPGTAGLIIALPALIGRFLSLLLLAMGLGWATSGDSPVDTGSSRWSWLAMLPAFAAIYGLLSLIGLPLTPGFAGRWAEIALVAGGGAWSGLLLVLGLAVATIATLRFVARSGMNAGAGRTLSRGGLIFTAILLGLSLLVGLFPDLIINTVSRLLGG